MILYSEFADGFQFSEDKERFGIFFFVAEIFNKYRNKLGLSWAKLGHSCVKLIRSVDLSCCLNGLNCTFSCHCF